MTIARRFPKSWAIPPIDTYDSTLLRYAPFWHPKMATVSGATISSPDNEVWTINGTTTWGKYGRTLDGTGDEIYNALQLDDYSAWWVGMWVQPLATPSTDGFFAHSGSYTVYSTDGTDIILNWGASLKTLTNVIAINRWSMIGIGRSGSSWEMDVDKDIALGATTSANTATGILLYLGSRGSAGYLPAVLGEVIIYSRLPSASERLRYYQSSKWRYR